MNAAHLFTLVLVNLRRDRRGLTLSAFGVAAGIAALTFFVALGSGVGAVVRTQIFPVDARFVEIVPPALSVGFLGATKLDDRAIEAFASMPEVSAVHRKMQLRVPARSRYDGAFFGKRLRMGIEVLGVGVDRALVAADLDDDAFVDPGETGSIPVVVSSRLLEIYNKSFAKLRGLPALSPLMLRGFSFPVDFGSSYVTGDAGSEPVRQKAHVVGVSHRGLLQGITIPIESAKRLNARFGADATSYSSVVLVAASPELVPALTAAVRARGFDIDDGERRLAESVGAAVSITTLALALLSVLICALATINIALTLGASVRSRAREIGILRAVGATSGGVARLVLAEAATIGLLGGVAGALLGRLAALGIDEAARRYLPEFPFKPESFFSFPISLLVGAVLVGVVSTVIGAYPPARRAAKLDPARAIAE